MAKSMVVEKQNVSENLLFPLSWIQHPCDWVKFHSHMNQRRHWQPTPVLLPGIPHGWRSLVGCSPQGRWESDRTERLHVHFSLGEGNGNPLQCSCLVNARDGGAWWLPSVGSHKSQTQLKQLSSSSTHELNRNSNVTR